MLYPPTSNLLDLHEPPVTRAVYDIPPVIVSSPPWARLRTFVAHVAGRPRGAAPRKPPQTAVGIDDFPA